MSVERGNVKILVFACRWCGLIGADGAGRKRIELPASYRVIPVDCAGYVEPDAVIRAFASGATGVAVLGCHVGGCLPRITGAGGRLCAGLHLGLLPTGHRDPI